MCDHRKLCVEFFDRENDRRHVGVEVGPGRRGCGGVVGVVGPDLPVSVLCGGVQGACLFTFPSTVGVASAGYLCL